MARRFAWLLPVWLLTLVTFAPVLRNEFVVDDWRFVVEQPDIRNLLTRPLPILLGNYFEVFDPRSIGKITFSLDYLAWELNPSGFHLTNLLLHGLVVAAVFLWAAWWLGRDDLAAIAAALFAVHPVHAETLSNVYLRNDILAALFSMMALMTFRAAGPPGEGARPERRRRLVATVVFLFLALAAKISAGILPLLFAIQDGIAGPRGTMRRRARDYVVFLAVTAAYGFLLNLNLARAYAGEGEEFTGGVAPLPIRLATTVKSVLDYVGVMFLPVVLRAEWNQQLREVLDPLAFAGLALGVGLLVAAVVYRRRAPLFSLAVIWTATCLLPYTNVVPLAYSYAERYLYLAIAAFSVALASLASRVRFATFPMPRGEVTGWVLVVIVAFAVRTHLRLDDWKDEETVWTQVVAHSPENPRGWRNLALADLRAGRLDEAEDHFARAATLAPSFHGAWSGLGVVRARSGDLPGAEEALRKAVRLAPTNYRHRLALGRVLDLQGRTEEAIEQWREVASIRPGSASPYVRIGATLIRNGRLEEAREPLERAIALDPSAWEGWARRAELRAATGDPEGARADLARAGRTFRGDARDAAQMKEIVDRVESALARGS